MKATLTLLTLLISFSSLAQEVEKIKMRSYKKPIIKAEINGKSGYFLVDTGSDLSIINSTDLDKYKLEARKVYGDHKRAIGFDGNTTSVMKVKDVSVVLGERFDHQSFYSLDIDRLVQTIEAKTNLTICGIIGADILFKYNCVIDYNQRHVILVDSRSKKRVAAK